MVTTYQTLEHVQNVGRCLNEMLRVLRAGGVLCIRAPDYNGFFEPHYRVFFLPRMNRRLAGAYLRLLRKPLLGLQTLRWVTEKEFGFCKRAVLRVERTNARYISSRREKIARRLPGFLRETMVPSFLNQVYGLRYRCQQLIKLGREESHIDLWVTRTE